MTKTLLWWNEYKMKIMVALTMLLIGFISGQAKVFLELPNEIHRVDERLKVVEREKEKEKSEQQTVDLLQDQHISSNSAEIIRISTAQAKDSVERRYIIQTLNRIDTRLEKFIDGYYNRTPKN